MAPDPKPALTGLDRLTRAVGVLLALPLVIFALPFIALALVLASIAGLILRAAGCEAGQSKGGSQ